MKENPGSGYESGFPWEAGSAARDAWNGPGQTRGTLPQNTSY